MKLSEALTIDLTPEQRALVFRVLWRFAMLIFVLWSFGAFASVGFPGYAKASDIDAIEEWQRRQAEQTTQMQVTLTEQSIWEVFARSCRAQGELREMHQRTLSGLQSRYKKLTGDPIQLPPCGAL